MSNYNCLAIFLLSKELKKSTFQDRFKKKKKKTSFIKYSAEYNGGTNFVR